MIKVVIPFVYDDIHYSGFKNGEVEVTLNGEKFYIDKTGKRID